LNANGENPKVQELMRHANLKVTIDTYVQAVTDEKREAQNKLFKMILPGIQRAAI
jgi:integrase